MKFAAFAIVAMANVVAGADPMPTALPPSKALEVAQSVSAPEGVEFTGSIEKIEQPTDATEIINALQTHDDADGDKKEEFGWGSGYGLDDWDNWGGWSNFGPYRFGFQCGAVDLAFRSGGSSSADVTNLPTSKWHALVRSAQRAKVSRHGAALECCGCRSRLRRGSWSVN
uniref:RxLR effector protein n=1 Tax=Phytophthora fragariae TaxID=53985 RepID=A0A6A3DVK4_9STRA|nr:hypothetical protein PF009_g25332 [Phytophthora fragariae]